MPMTEAVLRKRIALLFAELGTADAAAELSPRDDAALDAMLVGALTRYAPGFFAARFAAHVLSAYRRAHRAETHDGPTGNWTRYQALLARDEPTTEPNRPQRCACASRAAHLLPRAAIMSAPRCRTLGSTGLRPPTDQDEMNGNKATTLGTAHRICDQTLQYDALGQTTRCRLRLYRLDRAYVALLSEDPSNAGPSLHNTIEDALAYTREQWEILPKNLVAIEQRSAAAGEESFSRVSVRWTPVDGRIVVDRPRWSATTRAHVERVVGEPV